MELTLAKPLPKCAIHIQEKDYQGPVLKNWKRNGFGTQKLANGDQYEGQFKDDLFNSDGVYTFANGSVYTGQFKNGKKDGKGELKIKVKKDQFNVYTGTFKNGLKQGLFETVYANGDKFKGMYVNDKKQQGLLSYADGQTYQGAFSDNKFDGQCVFTSPDNFIYKGAVKNNQRQGSGVDKHGKDYIQCLWNENNPNSKGTIVIDNSKAKTLWVDGVFQ